MDEKNHQVPVALDLGEWGHLINLLRETGTEESLKVLEKVRGQIMTWCPPPPNGEAC